MDDDDADTDPYEWELLGGHEVDLRDVMAGRVLTHRVTADDLIDGRIDVLDPDVAALGLLIEDDLDAIELPAEAGAGAVVALRAVGGEPVLEIVDEASLASGDHLGPVMAEIVEEYGPVTDLDEVVIDVCTADATAFTVPTLPASEIAQRAGLEVAGGQVAVPGTDIARVQADERIASISRTHRIDEDQATAVFANLAVLRPLQSIMDLADAAEDEIIDTLAPEAAEEMDSEYRAFVRDVVSHLADPEVAEAFCTEALAISRHRAAALGMFAESYEPIAPRQARAAMRWLQARATERLGNPLEAERLLDQAESLDPSFAPALLDLARYASDRGDAERGLALLQRAGMGDDDDLVQLLQEMRPPERADLGRNSPCWCGSGRKYKACHRGKEQRPLADRASWLYAKAYMYLEDGPWRLLLMNLARARSAPRGPGHLLEALGDPFVIDVALAEGGAFAAFLDERGALLPADELLLAQQWQLSERSVFDIEQVRPGEGVTVRDLRTGERTDVQERLGSRQLKPGILVSSRILQIGDTWQFYGGLEPVGMNQREVLLALFDEDEPDPMAIVEALSTRLAPTQLQNTEGDPLVLCRTVVVPSDLRRISAALDARYDRVQDVPPVWHEPVITSGVQRIRATIEVEDGHLVVECNSEERQDRVLGALIELDGGLTITADERTPARTADEVMARVPAGRPDARVLDPTDPALAGVLAEVVAQYEQAWLDESIPALDGFTPRQAAADPTRRPDLVRLLDSFPESDDPGLMSPARLRRALGLA